MKNTRKLACTVIAAVFAVSTAAAQSFNSAEALKEYLDRQPANSPDKPIKVTVNANNQMIKNIDTAIKSAGKYVSLTLSGSALTAIPVAAFTNCKSLTSIEIPNSVTSIGAAFNIDDYYGAGAFQDCTNLTNVTIGSGVTDIGRSTFWDCTSLTAITVATANTAYSSDNGILYNKNKTTLIQYPQGKKGAFTIPNGVTSIGSFAFQRCTGLTSVTIPNSVTEIGDQAFADCTSLTSVTIPNSVTSIGEGAFSGCSNLTSVTFQGSIPSNNFGLRDDDGTTFYSPFMGDLRAKYLAGGRGTYKTTAPVSDSSVWTKQ